jgi:hypothetical protein
MAVVIEISYFNSFLLKQVSKTDEDVVWPNGYPYNLLLPINGVQSFPGDASTSAVNQWVIEESRIRGGYNNTQVDLGVKAYAVDDNPNQQYRFNSMIYSGIFNSRTGINNTNQFSVADDISKSTDPANGSIQKLFAEDTNLIVLQENKISRAPIDKNVIYSAEGGGSLTASNTVIGTIQAYSGNYGISKNPESFAVYGYQKYFTDKYRNAVMRLSQDGLTEISSYGMSDYFRDQLTELLDSNQLIIIATVGSFDASENKVTIVGDVTNVQIGMSISINSLIINGAIVRSVVGQVVEISRTGSTIVATGGDSISFSTPTKSKAIGGYDIHNKNYVLSIQKQPTWAAINTEYNTLSFDELINGWVSFMTFKPTFMLSLKNRFYSVKGSSVYQHYYSGNGLNRGTFYGDYNSSGITFVFNQDSALAKNFKTVNYEGDSGWQIDSFVSDTQGVNLGNTLSEWSKSNDTIAQVPSYLGGAYDNNGSTYATNVVLTPPIYYYGFNRKENKYFANLVNNSVATNGEVLWGEDIAGIKGRYATVTISTDNITEVGGSKELWAVGSVYVKSSY